MANRNDPSRRRMLAACDEIGPDDGIDPREWAKAEFRRPPGRKALQLCRQVARVLQTALADCRDEVLSGLVVTAVTPAPHAGRLRVFVAAAPSAAVRDTAIAQEHLRRAAGLLRAEVAATIHRRKTPELAFALVASAGPE
jgi:ribosome-binding factor A